jgi:hypothetical protein
MLAINDNRNVLILRVFKYLLSINLSLSNTGTVYPRIHSSWHLAAPSIIHPYQQGRHSNSGATHMHACFIVHTTSELIEEQRARTITKRESPYHPLAGADLIHFCRWHPKSVPEAPSAPFSCFVIYPGMTDIDEVVRHCKHLHMVTRRMIVGGHSSRQF